MSDFSYANFIRILEVANERYEVRTLRDGIARSDRQQLFLRHDVDVSITRAVRMAEIEAAQGVRATYMFIPNSRLYSLQDEANLIREFIDLGHEVALHFDVDDERRKMLSPISDVLDEIEADCQRISDVSGEPVQSISFHRPMPQFLRGDLLVAGRINAYAEQLMRAYISDSRGNWRCGDPTDYLKRSESEIVQLLIHPIWWSTETLLPEEQLERFFHEMTHGLDPRTALAFDQDLAFTVPGIMRSQLD